MRTTAELSNLLFYVALGAYLAAMIAYFFRMAFTRVSVGGVVASTLAGERAGLLGTALTLGGVVAHAGSVLTRGLAADRVPWANMYEYSSLMALVGVAIGLVVVQRRFRAGHLMGFVVGGAVLLMATGLMLFVPAGPVVPALESYWLQIHVSAMAVASSILMVGFVTTIFYLIRDVAERRLAERSGAGFGARSVGAASVDGDADRATDAGRATDVLDRDDGAAVVVDRRDPAGVPADDGRYASPDELRGMLSATWFAAVPGAVTFLFTLAIGTAVSAVVAGVAAAVMGLAAWYAVPFLPAAASLDNLTYRVIAFGMPVLTFGIIAGAVWGEEAWGRYWGWDPKETGSFFTWVLYAAYLHARATHGWRGRRAAWIGIAGFVGLMVTKYVVNLVVSGLHSYAT